MTASRMRPADLAMALFATSVWAGAFIVTEVALRDTPPMLFAAMRFVVSALFVLVVPFCGSDGAPSSRSASSSASASMWGSSSGWRMACRPASRRF